MLTLPAEIMPILGAFAPVFSERVWDWVQVLVIGAILAPGKRTVSAVLTIVGQRQDEQYQNYHRVLNRAVWWPLEVSQILLGLLVAAFSAAGVPIIVAADETLERRQGEKIQDKGVYRGPVEQETCRDLLRLARGEPDAAGASPLEPSGVGVAVSDRLGSQRRNQSAEWQAA